MTEYRRTAPNWRDYAACRDEDPELFFPDGNTGPARQQAEQAKQVCKRCAAIGHCALLALESGVDDGVWGGMTEDERRIFKRRRARSRSPLSTESYAQGLHEDFERLHPDYYLVRGLTPLDPVLVPLPEIELQDAQQSNQNRRA